MSTLARCKVCGALPEAHEDLNHEFSKDGQLVPKVKRPRNDDTEHIIRVRAEQTTAARLAAVLHKREVISDLDLVFVLTGGRDGGNASSRPRPQRD